MQLYVADYLADTTHLTAAQHGGYLLLLMNYWQRGKALPNSDARLAVTARMTAKEWATNKGALSEFFTVTEAEWTHDRVERDLTGVQEKSVTNKANGLLGGRPRKPNGSHNKTQTKPNGFENETETKPIKRREEKNRTEEPPTPPVFDHQGIATAFLVETGTHGLGNREAVAATALNEIARGRESLEVKDHLIRQWTRYLSVTAELEWQYGSPAQFFNSGRWASEEAWPWKENRNGSTGDNRQSSSRTSPAVERSNNNISRIVQATARAAGRSVGTVDGGDPGKFPQPGVPGRDGGHVAGPVAGDGSDERAGSVSPRTLEGNP